MHIPKYIVERMHIANALKSEGNVLIDEIQRYFEGKGVTAENVDRIRQLDIPHNDCTDELIEILKGE